MDLKLDSPNDILGVSYIKEINRLNSSIKPLFIKRTNDYHGNDINEISSASAIRNAIKNNIKALRRIELIIFIKKTKVLTSGFLLR